MKNIIFLLLISLSSLWAKNMAEAITSCNAYNNMKHSKNRDNLKIEVGKSYFILEKRDKQFYIQTEYKNVPNRWVDKNCFKISTTKKNNSKSTNTQQLLALSWQNAFCETHRNKRECKKNAPKRYTDTAFGLHGLWPQPRSNIYCGVSAKDKKFDKNHQWNRLPKLNLSPSTIKELKEVMAGYDSNLHRHEWIKHGTCSNLSADEYYKKAISLTKSINNSQVGQLFKKNIGKVIKLKDIQFKMNRSFGIGSGKRLELRCRGGLITELWIHIGGNSNKFEELLKSGIIVSSRCKQGKVDRVGF